MRDSPHTTLTTKRLQNAGSKMKAACNFIAIDCLVARVGKKLPVDIVGIVTAVTPLSSVKRTADGSEISRRCALCNCHQKYRNAVWAVTDGGHE